MSLREWAYYFNQYFIDNIFTKYTKDITSDDKLIVFTDDTTATKHDRIIKIDTIREVIKDDIIRETTVNIGYYYYRTSEIDVDYDTIRWVINNLNIRYSRAFYYAKTANGDLVVELDVIQSKTNGIGVRSRKDDLHGIVVILTT